MDPDFHKLKTVPDMRSLGHKRNLPLPAKIGPYKIESLLNQGGMSLLYLGIHPTTFEPIAVKVLLPKHLKNKEISARFLNEAKIIEEAHHPNIVKLYQVGQWEKGLYIAMEFIRGVSLRQFIQKKSFSLKKALEIILEVAHALAHLHSHGVIHRDLKPENILITENGSIKLIDFGIAQLQDSLDLDEGHKKMGTPFYMSPEQLENSNHVTSLTDIYALGVIAYELILGKSTHGIIHLELLSSHLRKIIEKCLQIDPKLRYQKISDFIADVSHYLNEFEVEKEEREKTDSQKTYSIEPIQSLLLPKKGVRSPQVEIGIAIEEGMAACCPYLDFFSLSDNRLVVVVGQPVHTDAISLTHSAMLRGMVRMAIQNGFQSEKKQEKIEQILQCLNQAIYQDPKMDKFHFSFLLLTPEKNLLSFVSCHFTNLWHIEEGSKKIRELSTPNPFLGQSANTVFIETTDNWNSGDLILLPTMQTTKDPEEVFELIANEYKLLSPQHLANQLKLSLQDPHRTTKEPTSLVLAIHRIF